MWLSKELVGAEAQSLFFALDLDKKLVCAEYSLCSGYSSTLLFFFYSHRLCETTFQVLFFVLFQAD